MPRAPFQVLVLPYRRRSDLYEYAVFCRSDNACWQGIAGGGENDETPLQAARREVLEETGIESNASMIALDAICSIPAIFFRDHVQWGESTYVIPEYSFGLDCTQQPIVLSPEHSHFEWLMYEEASDRFSYPSNRTALWELSQRLCGRDSYRNAR